MIVLPGIDAYKQLFRNVRAGTFSMPPKLAGAHYVDGGIFPPIDPPFKLKQGGKIFTIGSCFAREVESVLLDCGFDVPSAEFEIPPSELPFPGPHLLNEYNAGTIVQRLESVAGRFTYGDKGIEITDRGAIDLFVHIGSSPVTLERLHERRRQIALLNQQILASDVVVITLGLVESWFDTQDDCYLNRAPSQKLVRAEPGRYEFHRMDVDDVCLRVERGIELLIDRGVANVILTVSPVPVEATFMPDSCPISNSYSKAVLRVCADLITKKYEQVTYFPSFEIVNSFGTRGFLDDNIHVQPWVVHHIMHYWLANFLEKPSGALYASAASQEEAVGQGMEPGEPGDTSIALNEAAARRVA